MEQRRLRPPFLYRPKVAQTKNQEIKIKAVNSGND